MPEAAVLCITISEPLFSRFLSRNKEEESPWIYFPRWEEIALSGKKEASPSDASCGLPTSSRDEAPLLKVQKER